MYKRLIKLCFSFLILFPLQGVYGQFSACDYATPICSDEAYTFPNATNTSIVSGPNYGCLNDPNLMGMQNPLWYYMQIGTGGIIELQISQTNNYGQGIDLDFVMWGPFNTLEAGCQQVMNGLPPIQCSSSPLDIETIGIGTIGGSNYWYDAGVSWLTGMTSPPPAQSGDVYIILITNAANQLGTINIHQTNTGQSGAGDTDCSIVVPCQINSLTAAPDNCNPTTNTFSVSGTIVFQDAPDTGNLIIEDCNGNTVSYPVSLITSPLNYVITNIPSDGETCEVTAYFSEETLCTETSNAYQNPQSCECIPPQITSSDITVCSGESVTLTDLVDNSSAYTLTFHASQSDAENKIYALGNTVTSTSSTTIYVRAEVAGQINCYTIEEINIEVYPSPSINAGQEVSINCVGSATLGGNPEQGFSYTWSPSEGLSADNIANPIAQPESSTTYTLIITSGECIFTSEVTVVVEPIITPSFNQIGPFCEGEETTLPSTSIEGVMGSWTPSVNTLETTVYFFEPFANQCADTIELTIEVLENQTPTFEQIAPVCQGEQFSLPTTSLEGIEGSWSPPPNNNATTTYNFIASSSYSCVESVQMQVEIYSSPDLSVEGNLIIYEGEDSTTVLSVYGADTYYWSHNLGEGSVKEVSPKETTVYTVVGINENGCKDSININVEVRYDLIYYIPNAFTPDNDDFNEVFKPIFTKGFDPMTYTLFIYNRWGEILFESNDVDVGWDGNYQMNKTGICPDGIYIWKFRIKLSDKDQFIEKMGHINLIR